MDDSSDFQKKKTISGPKTAKPAAKKPRQKLTKRLKGQKNIKAALLKKNDIVSYTNDFNKVCQQSGVDVDSEQLQLAIALSESVQQDQEGCSSTHEPQNTKALNSKERICKIRTVLQQYGFKVPITKKALINKRVKKDTNKAYKLLLATEAEKKQIVADKFAQILFENPNPSLVYDHDTVSKNTEVKLYHLATNITYDHIKSDDIYYVLDLLNHSPNATGSLLKNWSDIPGRPPSPLKTRNKKEINLTNLNLTQQELNIMLSGTMKEFDKLLTDKQKENESLQSIEDKCVVLEHVEIVNSKENLEVYSSDKKYVSKEDVTESFQPHRSLSPDLFDDEVSEVIDNSKNTMICLDDSDVATTTNSAMQMTDCLEIVTNSNTKNIFLANENVLTLSQRSDITRRVSNDCMEMTDCVAGTTQAIRTNTKAEIDLTQFPDEGTPNKTANKKNNDKFYKNKNIDLTQSSPNDDEPLQHITLNETVDQDETDCTITNSPKVTVDQSIANERDIVQPVQKSDITRRVSNDCMEITECIASSSQPIKVNAEESIDLTQLPAESTTVKSAGISNNIDYDNIEKMDLTQSSDSNDSLPFVFVGGIENNDDTIILNDIDIHKPSASNISVKLPTVVIEEKDSEVQINDIVSSQSFYEEYVYTHSPHTTDLDNNNDENGNIDCDNDIDAGNEVDLTQGSDNDQQTCINSMDLTNSSAQEVNEINIASIAMESGDIDLTQNSTSDDDTHKFPTSTNRPQTSTDSLGRKDDVSIDYDDVLEVNDSVEQSKQINDTGFKEHLVETPKKSNSEMESLSQSEIFEISDNELDYSMQKSRHEMKNNFELGGISIIDHLRSTNSFRNTNSIENNIENDDILPEVDVGGYESITRQVNATPTKTIGKGTAVSETPANSEYIIKTDRVSPILDYDNMVTPEIHAELCKYGLKPFKRKRAIQLLTHIYNQTHPIVEMCSTEDLPSPCKKRKIDRTPLPSPSKRNTDNKSPNKRKQTKVPVEAHSMSPGKENIYEVSTNAPVIKEFECDSEDWVFQKREKAKIHSCRVPLHIAFHNYISNRPELRASILRYEPLNIDVVHKELVMQGHRYDPKDLLRFLDKRCITVKTANANSKHY